MFLTDVFIIENLQILEEASSDKPMKVRGIFQRAEEANNNKRIYPRSVLEMQMGKLQPLIEGRRLCGELDHPSNDTVKLSNASHLITKLEMKGNEVLGEAEILNTPAGLTAKALIKGGVQIGISSRGMGTLSESADGTKKVNEDFKLVTFDLVADPSTRGAYPTLAESTQYQEILKKTTQERVFIMQLEEAIEKQLKLDELKVAGLEVVGPGRIKKAAMAKKEEEEEEEQKEEEQKERIRVAAGRIKSERAGTGNPTTKTKNPATKTKNPATKTKKPATKTKKPASKRPLTASPGWASRLAATKEKWMGPRGTTRRGLNIGIGGADVATRGVKGVSSRFANIAQKFAGSTGIKGVQGATGGQAGVSARLAPPSRVATEKSKKALEAEDLAKRKKEAKKQEPFIKSARTKAAEKKLKGRIADISTEASKEEESEKK